MSFELTKTGSGHFEYGKFPAELRLDVLSYALSFSCTNDIGEFDWLEYPDPAKHSLSEHSTTNVAATQSSIATIESDETSTTWAFPLHRLTLPAAALANKETCADTIRILFAVRKFRVTVTLNMDTGRTRTDLPDDLKIWLTKLDTIPTTSDYRFHKLSLRVMEAHSRLDAATIDIHYDKDITDKFVTVLRLDDPWSVADDQRRTPMEDIHANLRKTLSAIGESNGERPGMSWSQLQALLESVKVSPETSATGADNSDDPDDPADESSHRRSYHSVNSSNTDQEWRQEGEGPLFYGIAWNGWFTAVDLEVLRADEGIEIEYASSDEYEQTEEGAVAGYDGDSQPEGGRVGAGW
jgi:hypothetical protein